MNKNFYLQIVNSSALRKSREENKNVVISHPEFVSDLLEMAFNTVDKNHFKSCWTLELVCEEKPELLIPFIAVFCKKLSSAKNESAIRSLSKICMLLTRSKIITLTKIQKQKIIDSCFEWLISATNVAPKVYSMYTLCQYSTTDNWIKEELKIIISKDYSSQSAGYKAAAKKVLKKINN